MTAHIFQINVSDGGVPKRPLHKAEINTLGLVGDNHNDKRYHGGPKRAVSLYSLERILALQAEGHPIYPGSTGENITVSGLDWARAVPGVCLQLGDEVEIEIKSYATPCRNIVASFHDGNMNRISAKKYPGWARVYAAVITEGHVRIGDSVRLK